jgi:hypothetical protein
MHCAWDAQADAAAPTDEPEAPRPGHGTQSFSPPLALVLGGNQGGRSTLLSFLTAASMPSAEAYAARVQQRYGTNPEAAAEDQQICLDHQLQNCANHRRRGGHPCSQVGVVLILSWPQPSDFFGSLTGPTVAHTQISGL